MSESCPKCGGSMDNGRIPAGLKYFFGYKSLDQKRFTMECTIEKARACEDCGYLELYVDPAELKRKHKD